MHLPSLGKCYLYATTVYAPFLYNLYCIICTISTYVIPRLSLLIKYLRPLTGRTMYVVPFSMGPVGGPLSKNGIELTDSAYVAVNMHVMARVGMDVYKCVQRDGQFVRYLLRHECNLITIWAKEHFRLKGGKIRRAPCPNERE